MSAIKRALIWIQYVINNYGFDNRRLCVDEAHAIKRALEEEQKREKGCKYCKVPGKYLATIDYDGAETRLFFDVVGNSLRVFDEEMPGLCDSFSIKFCPLCGRKLVQE